MLSFVFIILLIQKCKLPYNPCMTKNDLIKLAGSQCELAKLLRISQPAISAWKQVPEARMWQLKVLRPEWFEKNQL
jgi:hypothetical protein